MVFTGLAGNPIVYFKIIIMTTSTKVVLGIFGALAAGVAIGLLIAPEKGEEMRNRIKKTAGGWADNLSNLFVKGKEEAEALVNRARGAKGAAEDSMNSMKESLG
jgi:gas vesicle protein